MHLVVERHSALSYASQLDSSKPSPTRRHNLACCCAAPCCAVAVLQVDELDVDTREHLVRELAAMDTGAPAAAVLQQALALAALTPQHVLQCMCPTLSRPLHMHRHKSSTAC